MSAIRSGGGDFNTLDFVEVGGGMGVGACPEWGEVLGEEWNADGGC